MSVNRSARSGGINRDIFSIFFNMEVYCVFSLESLMSVNRSARSGGINRDIFSIFFNMKVYCVFSLESPHQDDSNVYTQCTIL